MNIYSSIYFGYQIFYFSSDKNSIYIPDIWITYKDNKWRICGSISLIDKFIPDKYHKFGFKNSSLAFSYLKKLYEVINNFSLLEKKKYCLVNTRGLEYNKQTLHKFNESYRSMNIKPKIEVKNEKRNKKAK